MKRFIVVHDKHHKKAEVVAQFDNKADAEEYALSHEGMLWVFTYSF